MKSLHNLGLSKFSGLMKASYTETGSLKRGLVKILAATGAQLLIASVMVLLAGSVDWESFFCMDHVWIRRLLGCCADGES